MEKPNNMSQVEPGIYKHYKGNLYEVIGVATHSETKERFVIYRAVYPVRGRPANPIRNTISNGAGAAATTALGRSASNGASGDYELWARPEKMFFEDIDMPEYNYRGSRFTFVNPVRSQAPSAFAVPFSAKRTSNGVKELN